MVILLNEFEMRVPLPRRWNAICYDVMCGLDVEGFLDFGERGEVQMKKDKGWKNYKGRVPCFEFHNRKNKR